MLSCLLVPIFPSFVSESPPPQGADSLLCSPWHNRALFRDWGSRREKGKDGQLPAGLAMSLFPDQQPDDSEVTARWQPGAADSGCLQLLGHQRGADSRLETLRVGFPLPFYLFPYFQATSWSSRGVGRQIFLL